MRWLWMICIALVISPLFAAGEQPIPDKIQPADPDLIPEARAVLDYLRSIYGKKTLSGISGTKNAAKVKEITGKDAAIVAIDLSGWNSPRWGKTYTPVVQGYIDQAKQWSAEGGIVSIQFHWKHPLKDDGTAWVGKHGNGPPSGPFDMGKALLPDTPEHKAFMTDLDKHADYLEQLAKAKVPVLWRPFHEIDGGWFWWTDKDKPENTAAMWRIMFDHLVKQRKLHNLIWVYNAGLKSAGPGKDVAAIEYRKRFYPGAEYVDIAGIDIYANSYFGWAKPQEDAYQKAFDIMTQVAPGKMLAMSECEAIPNPDMMAKNGPKWLYCLPWWAEGKTNPAEWMKTTYGHEFVITRDELPRLGGER